MENTIQKTNDFFVSDVELLEVTNQSITIKINFLKDYNLTIEDLKSFIVILNKFNKDVISKETITIKYYTFESKSLIFDIWYLEINTKYLIDAIFINNQKLFITKNIEFKTKNDIYITNFYGSYNWRYCQLNFVFNISRENIFVNHFCMAIIDEDDNIISAKKIRKNSLFNKYEAIFDSVPFGKNYQFYYLTFNFFNGNEFDYKAKIKEIENQKKYLFKNDNEVAKLFKEEIVDLSNMTFEAMSIVMPPYKIKINNYIPTSNSVILNLDFNPYQYFSHEENQRKIIKQYWKTNSFSYRLKFKNIATKEIFWTNEAFLIKDTISFKINNLLSNNEYLILDIKAFHYNNTTKDLVPKFKFEQDYNKLLFRTDYKIRDSIVFLSAKLKEVSHHDATVSIKIKNIELIDKENLALSLEIIEINFNLSESEKVSKISKEFEIDCSTNTVNFYFDDLDGDCEYKIANFCCNETKIVDCNSTFVTKKDPIIDFKIKKFQPDYYELVGFKGLFNEVFMIRMYFDIRDFYPLNLKKDFNYKNEWELITNDNSIFRSKTKEVQIDENKGLHFIDFDLCNNLDYYLKKYVKFSITKLIFNRIELNCIPKKVETQHIDIKKRIIN